MHIFLPLKTRLKIQMMCQYFIGYFITKVNLTSVRDFLWFSFTIFYIQVCMCIFLYIWGQMYVTHLLITLHS